MADNTGGRQNGYGRAKGTPNKASTERKEALVQALKATETLPDEVAGLTPLAVMLTAMRRCWNRNQIAEAVKIACLAAPYMHPRLTSADLNVKHADAEKSDEQLMAELQELRRKQAARVN